MTTERITEIAAHIVTGLFTGGRGLQMGLEIAAKVLEEACRAC